MKVLVVGSGGREHVLVWKIKQSNRIQSIYCAPGNGGIADIAECIDIQATDIPRLVAFARDNHIDLTVIGPEAPLVEGIVDAFDAENLRIFGPCKAAARLEGSKVFAKEFMYRHNIPTAEFEVFDDIDKAKKYISKAVYPLVIKADGLAAGKGVIICNNMEEGNHALDDIMSHKIFKSAGDRVVIEECLKGEELSILAISDGKTYRMFEPSQDHKRIFDGDLGPNTGGMGAYSPVPIATVELINEIEHAIISPVIKGMREEGTLFKGILYCGLMITEDGPKVLEFNVRFGDPEAQVVLPRMRNDIVELMLLACDGRLDEVCMEWDSRSCVCVVMASSGYPGKYEKGKQITGLDDILQQDGDYVFHAGTLKDNGEIITAGGRVLGVSSLGDSLEDAIQRVYKAVDKIHFDGCFFRKDIGAKAMAHRSIS